MYTIEEAKLSRHNPTYHIPTAAARDCGREGIIRALEQKNQRQEGEMVGCWQFVLPGRRSSRPFLADRNPLPPLSLLNQRPSANRKTIR